MTMILIENRYIYTFGGTNFNPPENEIFFERLDTDQLTFNPAESIRG